MNKELTCEQVGAIITFYIENRLSNSLKKAVKHHLDICPDCRTKYEELQKMVQKFTKNECPTNIDEEVHNEFKKKQYAEFKLNLSAYIDNELDDSENIRIKKITISNPMARRDLEEMYAFKKLLHTSFDKTKNDIRYDFSKNILTQMNFKQKKDPFWALFSAFVVMFAIIITGVLQIWFLNS